MICLQRLLQLNTPLPKLAQVVLKKKQYVSLEQLFFPTKHVFFCLQQHVHSSSLPYRLHILQATKHTLIKRNKHDLLRMNFHCFTSTFVHFTRWSHMDSWSRKHRIYFILPHATILRSYCKGPWLSSGPRYAKYMLHRVTINQ